MTHKVTGCEDCPYYKGDQMFPEGYCRHPKIPLLPWNEIKEVSGEPRTPYWCPLIKEPITIEYEPRENSSE